MVTMKVIKNIFLRLVYFIETIKITFQLRKLIVCVQLTKNNHWLQVRGVNKYGELQVLNNILLELGMALWGYCVQYAMYYLKCLR